MNMFRAFIELDEAYNDRQALIDEIKKSGKNYNFAKYTDNQLYRMAQRLRQSKLATKEPAHDLDLDFELKKDFEYCECGEILTDFGQCPVCDFGEEDLYEDTFDEKPSTLHFWKTSSGQPINVNSVISQPAAAQVAIPQQSGGKCTVRIVFHSGRLRALGTDGVHPAAWVAFPNDLRQFEGQLYEVDQLIWNGKNYRVAGNIVEI